MGEKKDSESSPDAGFVLLPAMIRKLLITVEGRGSDGCRDELLFKVPRIGNSECSAIHGPSPSHTPHPHPRKQGSRNTWKRRQSVKAG